MADQLGSFTAGSTVYGYFTTHATSGAPVAPLSAFENADLRIYKNGSATERSSSSGITMTSPFDSTTGLHAYAIDLSDNTDAGFYAAGSEYAIVLNPDSETVDGVTVLKVLAYFAIERVPKVNVTQFGGSAGTFASGRPEVNTTHLAGTSQTARDIGASVLLSSGTGTGQISLSSGTVTIGTNNDKTGYSLSQAFPANFAALGINASGHVSRVTLTDTVTALTNAPSDSSGVTTLLSRVTGAVLLAANVPANFNLLAIDGSGQVTIGGLGAGSITSSTFAPGTTIPRCTLVDTCTTNSDYTTPPTALENADALLKRDWTAVSGSPADRSVWQALRSIRNRWYFDGDIRRITEEDDTAVAWSETVETTVGALPVTATNPS